MQRRVGLLLAVLALVAPLLSEVNHSLGQVMRIFIGSDVVVVQCRWEKREVGLLLEKTKETGRQL